MKETRASEPLPIEPDRALRYIKSLPPQQKVVLQMWADGKNKAQAAMKLGVAEGTADTHIRRVAENFSVQLSRRKALIYLIRVGVIKGVIKHELPDDLVPLAEEESQLAKVLRAGKTIGEINAPQKLLRKMQKRIYEKLNVINDYHLAARLSALELKKIKEKRAQKSDR